MPANRRGRPAPALKVSEPAGPPAADTLTAVRPAPCIYSIPQRLIGRWDAFGPHLDRAQSLGFDAVLVSPLFKTDEGSDVFTVLDHEMAAPSLFGDRPVTEALSLLRSGCDERGLALFLDLVLDRLSANHRLVRQQSAAFTVRRDAGGRSPIDPRQPPPLKGEAFPRFSDASAADLMQALGCELIRTGVAAGVRGFRILGPGSAPPSFWRTLLRQARASGGHFFALAETEGLPRSAAKALVGCGFDAFTSSLASWDGRASWMIEEYEDLRPIAPLIAVVEAPFGPRTAASGQEIDPLQASRRTLELAAATGSGLLVPIGFEFGATDRLDPHGGGPHGVAQSLTGLPPLADEIRQATRRAAELAGISGELRRLSGAGSPVTPLLRFAPADVPSGDEALLALVNTSLTQTETPDPAARRRLWSVHNAGWGPGALQPSRSRRGAPGARP